MNQTDPVSCFISQALDATAEALEALADGGAVRADDLLSGAMALGWIADHNDDAAAIDLAGIARTRIGLRIIARQPVSMDNADGRAAVSSFLDVVTDLRAHYRA